MNRFNTESVPAHMYNALDAAAHRVLGEVLIHGAAESGPIASHL